MPIRLILTLTLSFFSGLLQAAEPTKILDLWPAKPPGEMNVTGPERDMTKPTAELIAGRRIIRLGYVVHPQLYIFLPPKEKATGAAMIVCPGGGYNILAWDLEGLEVAEWLNSIGVAGVVLKYRVPTCQLEQSWMIPRMDGQRAFSVVRSHASEWGLDPTRIGALGFSSGGNLIVGLALNFDKRSYAAVDDADKLSCRPDFVMPLYSSNGFDKKTGKLRDWVVVPKNAPPMCFVHAFDDPCDVRNALLLASAAKEAGVPCELHIYDVGGHGYGLRPQADKPVTTWPARCTEWLARNGWLAKKPTLSTGAKSSAAPIAGKLRP